MARGFLILILAGLSGLSISQTQYVWQRVDLPEGAVIEQVFKLQDSLVGVGWISEDGAAPVGFVAVSQEGKDWTPIQALESGPLIDGIVMDGTIVVLSSHGEIFYSSDSGNTWQLANIDDTGLQGGSGLQFSYGNLLIHDGQFIAVVGQNVTCESPNFALTSTNGVEWEVYPSYPDGRVVAGVGMSDGVVALNQYYGGICIPLFRSTLHMSPDGTDWNNSIIAETENLSGRVFMDVFVLDDELYVLEYRQVSYPPLVVDTAIYSYDSAGALVERKVFPGAAAELLGGGEGMLVAAFGYEIAITHDGTGWNRIAIPYSVDDFIVHEGKLVGFGNGGFTLLGEPAGNLPIPTLNYWMMFLLAGLLVLVAGRQFFRYRRS